MKKKSAVKNKSIRRSVNPFLEIRDSEIEGAGKGLFTTIERNAGDFICYYEGENLSEKQLFNRYKNNKKMTYVLQRNQDSYIDARDNPKLLARYINSYHNSRKKTNCKYSINPRTNLVSVKATTHILPNSELLIAYGRSHKIKKKSR